MIRLVILLAAVLAVAMSGGTVYAKMVMQIFPVLAGAGAHDVYPAPDGAVWFTAQSAGKLGRLDPRTGKSDLIALGPGAAPHGVIVGPDGAAWVTEGGQNAIARVDPATHAVKLFSLPKERRNANLNTAAFDRQGMLWFTGQNGIYGRLDPKSGTMAVYDAPRGTGPYGIASTPDGQVFFASLAGNYLGQINLAGCLRPGYRGGLEWKRDGERVASVRLQREQDRLILSYRVRQHDGEWQGVEQPTPIVWRSCRFGGARPYFVCPGIVNGIACGRRASKLYGAGTYFLCRHYRLAYTSQREDRYDGALRRANNICMQLGGKRGTGSLFPNRPKGMHHKTYKRLQSAVLSAELLAEERLVIFLERLQRRERRSERRVAGRPSKEFWT
jgi:hypothetical protein